MTHEEKQEKWREHLKLERRYMSLMHTAIGRVWDIPECCIKQFVEESKYGIMSAQYRQLKHNKMLTGQVDYVPCDECMGKI